MHRLAAFAIVFWSVATLSWAIDPNQRQPDPPREAPQQTTGRTSTNRAQSTPPAAATPAPTPTAIVSGPWLLASTNESAWFGDQVDVSWRNGRVRMWTTMVYANVSYQVKYAVGLTEFNCEERTFATLSGNFYGPAGEVVGTIGAEDFEYAVPGSAFASVLNAACSDFRDWGTDRVPVVQVPYGLTVVQAADNLFRSQAQSK